MLNSETWKIYYWVDRMATQLTAQADEAAAKTGDDVTNGATWLYAKSVALREVCIGILDKDFAEVPND